MNCFCCKGDIVDGVTSYVTDLENCIVIIKNVPCHRCTQCGEESFSGGIVQKIEVITDRFRDALTEFAVVNFDKLSV